MQLTVVYVGYASVLIASALMSRMRTVGLTPLVVFIGVSIAAVILYLFDGMLFQIFNYTITPSAHLMRICSLFVFMAGALLVRPFYQKRRVRMVGACSRLEKITDGLILLMAVCAFMRILTITIQYGNPIAALPRVRDDFVAGALVFPRWTSLATLAANLLALNIGFLIGAGVRAYKRVFVFIVLAVLNDSTAADKAGLRLIIMLVFAVYYTRMYVVGKPFSFGIYVRCFLFGISVFAIYSTITYFRVVDQSASVIEVTVKHLYMNFVGNFASSAWFLDNPWPKAGFGVYSFPGFYQLLGISSLEEHRLASFFNADIVPVGIFNTSDYIAYINADFGLVGVLTVSGVMGLFSAWLHCRAYNSGGLLYVQLVSLGTAGLVVSIRGFYFGAPGFWVTMVLLVCQHFYVTSGWLSRSPKKAALLVR